MAEEEERVKAEAVAFANKNKKRIVRERTDLSKFPPDPDPVSVFMAGSPGAGKTESSENLIHALMDGGHAVLRIDPDELRSYFNWYNGKNSYLFQGATSILAECMQDYALSNKQSFVFDGTLSNLGKARLNIKRSLSRGRLVQIIYVYQDPFQAWEFVKMRQRRDGRYIAKEVFVDEYFQARDNVHVLKGEYGSAIKVDLLVKYIDGSNFFYRENIDNIDSYVPEKYTREQLLAGLGV